MTLKTRILITGASGNVGKAVINSLSEKEGDFQIQAGLRNTRDEKEKHSDPRVKLVHFDFEDEHSMRSALTNCDILFLLRPPQIADVEKYFAPLIRFALAEEIHHVVFLSVQGAEKNSFIPHFKIEKLIRESGLPYTFLRPAYFMQNFTTTLLKDIVDKQLIYLPAGKAKFNLIDVQDLGDAAAEVLLNTKSHRDKAYPLSNGELLDFQEMSEVISKVTEQNISYESPNLIAFYRQKRREGKPTMLILVMIMLHFLPRFTSAPNGTDDLEKITGKKAKTFKAFVLAHKEKLSIKN
tara:strand:- start:1257 stop:2141 length:885 start_codon:yes stop_codon:yes gene_type:complete